MLFLKTHLKIFLIFLLGLGLGWFLAGRFPAEPLTASFQPLRSPLKEFTYINPLIGFDVVDQENFSEFKFLKSSLENFIFNQESYGKYLRVSLYFRNLTNGHWLGINENDVFNPGSLMKVPIMIAFFKNAETKPEIFNKTVFYSGNEDAENSALVKNPLESELIANKSYSIQELIRSMIVDSDNGALNLLISNINKIYLNEVFSDFGVQEPKDFQYSISPKTYANFFRRLHNATYLNREFSEQALKLLTEVSYDKGIKAGISQSAVVAHKYGERGLYEGEKLVGVELHDCGIIYYSDKHLLLCVMTKGNNLEVLESIISGITKIVNNFSAKI